jgi:hypothetical protein
LLQSSPYQQPGTENIVGSGSERKAADHEVIVGGKHRSGARRIEPSNDTALTPKVIRGDTCK